MLPLLRKIDGILVAWLAIEKARRVRYWAWILRQEIAVADGRGRGQGVPKVLSLSCVGGPRR